MYRIDEKASHILCPSLGVAQIFFDLFEASTSQITDVVFMQTVAKQIQQTDQRMYTRLKALIKDPRRRFVVFSNENSADTFADRLPDESIKDRDERAVQWGVGWYSEHLDHGVPIVYLVEDERATALPSIPGVVSMTVGEYVKRWRADNRSLSDLYTSLSLAYEARPSEPSSSIQQYDSFFEPYKSTDVLEEGHRVGTLLRGVLHVNKFRTSEACVKCTLRNPAAIGVDFSTKEVQVSIVGSRNRNRALHGDAVYVQLLSGHEAAVAASQSQSQRGLQQQQEDQLDELLMDLEGGADEEETKPGAVVLSGKVVGVHQRNWRQYVATMQEDTSSEAQQAQAAATGAAEAPPAWGDFEYVLFVPMDRRIPKVRVRTKQKDRFRSARVVLRVDDWDRFSNYPSGHVVRDLGEINTIDTETTALLIENGIEFPPYPPSALSELPSHSKANPWCIPAKEFERRRDLRDTHCIFSVDPFNCEDIDDALSAKILPNGNVELGVHIADVTHFIAHDSGLDREARQRTTSVYLVDRRLDMIPTVLSADLCSLHMGHDRLAVSVLWEFPKSILDPTGQQQVQKAVEPLSVWYGPTIMRSKYAIPYEDAQEIIDGTYRPPEGPSDSIDDLQERGVILKTGQYKVTKEELDTVRHDLRLLDTISNRLRDKQLSEGTLELESLEEVKFELESGTGSAPTDIHAVKTEMPVKKMVACFMIYANQWVAKRIYEAFPSCAILRRHPEPSPDRFDALAKAAATKGFKIDTSSSLNLAMSLQRAHDPSDPTVGQLIRSMATRAMSEAEYFSTGICMPDQFRHYGLALDFYTHFTSPIRRYADVVVHRLLLAAKERDLIQESEGSVGGGWPSAAPFSCDELQSLCVHINSMHRASKTVQYESSEWFRALYFKNREVVTDAIVFGVRPSGLLAFVPQFRIKLPVYFKDRDGALTMDDAQDPLAPLSTEYNDKKLELSVTVDSLRPVCFRMFCYVTVRITVDEARVRRPDVRLLLARLKASPRPSAGRSAEAQLTEDEMREKMNNEVMGLMQLKKEMKTATTILESFVSRQDRDSFSQSQGDTACKVVEDTSEISLENLCSLWVPDQVKASTWKTVPRPPSELFLLLEISKDGLQDQELCKTLQRRARQQLRKYNIQ